MVNESNTLISNFEKNPTYGKLVQLVNSIKFEDGDSIDTPAEKLIDHLQHLSQALKGGNIDLTLFVDEIKSNANEVGLPNVQLNLTVTLLIKDNLIIGSNIARQYERFDEFDQALTDLKQQFAS